MRRAVRTQTLLLAALLAVSSLLGALPDALQAQVIKGTVIDDDTEQPVADVRVTLLRVDSVAQRFAITDSLGSFIINVAQLGDYMLKAERIGYAVTVSQEFPVAVMDTTHVQFFVSREAVLLAPLEVRVRPVQGSEVFAHRKDLGKGVFFDPQMVDSIRPTVHVGEILEHAEGVRVRWRWGYRENGSNGPIPMVNSYMGRDRCLYYIVDYTPVPDPWFEELGAGPDVEPSFDRARGWNASAPTGPPWGVSPLADLTPEDIVAVEVYRHISEVPEDFVSQLIVDTFGKRQKLKQMLGQDIWGPMGCGIVIFWTEDGW